MVSIWAFRGRTQQMLNGECVGAPVLEATGG